MEGSSLNAKIREIISHYKMTDRQFAIKIGVNQSVIGSMFQKGTEPSSKVIRNTMLSFPEISADWFIRNQGGMFREKDKSQERINKLVDIISDLQEAVNEKDKSIEILTRKIKELETK